MTWPPLRHSLIDAIFINHTKEKFIERIKKLSGDASDPHADQKIYSTLHELFDDFFIVYGKTLLPGTRVQS